MLEGGVRRAFCGLLEEDLDAFFPVFEGRHLVSRGFGDAVFHCLFAF